MTCCQGWQIIIDEEKLTEYKNMDGALRELLKDGVDWENSMFREENGFCKLLRKDGLCSLQYEKGENALCRTCAMYPRHIEEFEEVREYSLSLSCPEAARIILQNKNKLSFTEWEDDLLEDDDEFEEFDHYLYSVLLSIREKVYEIIQNRDIKFEQKLSYLLGFAIAVQECVDEDKICDIGVILDHPYDYECEGFKDKRAFSVMYELEKLSPGWLDIVDTTWENWDELFKEDGSDASKGLNLTAEEEIEAEQLLMFFTYTYLCGAVYDDWIHTKIMLSAFSVYWIFVILRTNNFEGGIIEASYLYAREVEHSDENLNALEEWFDSLL